MPDVPWQQGDRSSRSRSRDGGGRYTAQVNQAFQGAMCNGQAAPQPPARPGTLPGTLRAFPEAQPLMQQDAGGYGNWGWDRIPALSWMLPKERSCDGRGDQEAGGYRRHRRGDKGAEPESWLGALPEGLREQWQNPRVPVVAACLLCAGLTTLLVALLAPQLPHQSQTPPLGPLPPSRAPAQMPSGPRKWLLCPGPGQCDQPRLETWAVSPFALSTRVPDFSRIPGIPQEAYQPVADHWSQSPPFFHGSPVMLPEIAEFVRALLGSDPFGTGDQVPFVDLRPPGEGKVVAITQRQLAFLVANAFMGNNIPTGDGLSALLRRCSAKGKSGFLYALLSLLAVLSKELGPGEQGRMLVAATPRAGDEGWRQRLTSTSLRRPTVCVRQASGGLDCGLADFMGGGTPYQALTDIAGGVVGGGAQLCDVADSQDESLVQFYSEVLAFAFFVASGPGATGPAAAAASMLPVPFALLGARRYVRDIAGQSAPSASCGSVHAQNWLNEEIPTETTTVPVRGTDMVISASAFVAVASACSACIAGESCTIGESMNNQCDQQRRHLDDDLGRWYQAFEPTMYDPSVQEAFRRVVRRIGTGPWGAGVWYGDSQQYFLAVWLATSLFTGTTLDYYVYDHFCENPGNQCFVLGANDCRGCVARSGAGQVRPSFCGEQSYVDMIQRFHGMPSQALYAALKTVGSPPEQVFDLLATA